MTADALEKAVEMAVRHWWTATTYQGGEPFTLEGIAMDTYHGADGPWVLIARHVGMGQL